MHPQPRALHGVGSTIPSRRSRGASRSRARAACPRRRCARWAEQRRAQGSGQAGTLKVDRDLDRGRHGRRPTSAPGSVIETPGHAPSHVCLYQPERRLLISGDHLLGRVSLYFDRGFTPDPVGRVPRLARQGRAASTCRLALVRPRPAVHRRARATSPPTARSSPSGSTRSARAGRAEHRVRDRAGTCTATRSPRRRPRGCSARPARSSIHLERAGAVDARAGRPRALVGAA